MHAILVTMGTDGDVSPYVGLGVRLRGRGHRVTLAGPETYQALAARHGLGFHCLVSKAVHDEFLGSPDLWHPIKGGLHGARWGVRFIRGQYELLTELSRDADSVIVTNPGILAARLVQERHAKPVATLLLQPGLLPSVSAPPVMPAVPLPQWAPRWVGHIYWRMVDAAGDLLVGRELNRVRNSLGLPPVRRIFRWWLSPQLVIGMFPEWYAAPQADWPPQLRLAGFPQFDGVASAGLPADLVDFCRAAAPPIAFTLGTGMRHGAEFFHAAVEACGILGRRGILLTRHLHQCCPRRCLTRCAMWHSHLSRSCCPCALQWCTMAGSARQHGHWLPARRSLCCLWHGTSRTTRRVCVGSARAAHLETGTGVPRDWRKRWQRS